MRPILAAALLPLLVSGCMDTNRNGQPDAVAPEVRRAAGKSLEAIGRQARDAAHDARIAGAIRADLGKDPSVRLYRLGVEVEGSAVTLTGEVNSAGERQQAEQIARKQKGITEVRNRIQVRS